MPEHPFTKKKKKKRSGEDCYILQRRNTLNFNFLNEALNLTPNIPTSIAKYI